jgi:hypothetical protein
MAYVHEIKFFRQDNKLYVALFDNPTPVGEFWLKNVLAEDIGIDQLPHGLELETKYIVESLGIQPFPVSKPLFDFVDVAAKLAWEKGSVLAMKFISQ